MFTGTSSKLHYSSGPTPEWHDFSYLRPARSNRGAAISLFLVLWIAVADLCLPHTNLSILYVAPLMVLVGHGELQHLWQTCGILVLLTFGIYVLKNAIILDQSWEALWDYRLVNRTLVAVTLVVMSEVLRLWARWHADEQDLELPEAFRRQDDEVGATFAMLCCAPLVLIIAVVDFVSPANFNLAALYPVPLLVCGWTRSRPLLWAMLVILLLLTAVAYLFGPPPSVIDVAYSMPRNRALSAVSMVVVTVLLHYWIGRQQVRQS